MNESTKALTNYLKDLYYKIVQSKTDEKIEGIVSTSSFMNFDQTKAICDKFLDMVEKDIKPSEEEIDLLRWLLKLTNLIYNNSGENTGLTDSEYDLLSEYYKSVTNDESIITEEESGDTVNHKFITLRGTLDKIYKITDEDVLKNKSQRTLDDWIRQSEKRYYENTGKTINLSECEVMVMPKFDGVSCVFECDEEGNLKRALTRGDTTRNEAQDITHVFKDIFSGFYGELGRPVGLKTEIMMLDANLDELNEMSHRDYKNTRSIVSSILNSDVNDGREKYLHIVPLRYSYLDNKGNESQQYLPPEVYNYPYIKCKLNELDKIHDFAFSHKTVHPGLRCDGAVIRIMDEDVQKALGRENEKQKFEVAFKFTEETAYSKVKDIKFTTGLFGSMNPVVIIEPVKMKGNTVEKASLGSYGRYKKLKLAKGDKVKVLYDIIPYVDFDEGDSNCIRSENKPIKIDLFCPECGHPLLESATGESLSCINKECPSILKGQILNYCIKMNIANISYATIDDFYKLKILNSIEDLYKLKNHINIITQINGYGINKINNILEEIDTHRDVIPSVLLGSIGIEGISTKTFKKVLEYMTMKEIIDISHELNYDFFTVIPGIKMKTARKIVDGINSKLQIIQFLIQELNVQNEPRDTSDFSVVFTKFRDEDLEKYIESVGGSVSESLTKSSSILVIPMKGVKSSKVDKAIKYNIPVVTADELVSYIKDNYL